MTDLERRTDRLALACQALWETLSEQAGTTEDQVLERMHEIDLRDGKEDGRITGTTVKCVNCGNNVNSVALRCIYCGRPNATANIVR